MLTKILEGKTKEKKDSGWGLRFLYDHIGQYGTFDIETKTGENSGTTFKLYFALCSEG